MGFTFRVLPHVYLLHQSHDQSPDATRFYTNDGGGGVGGGGEGGRRCKDASDGPLGQPICQQMRILALDARLAVLTWKRPFFTGMSSSLYSARLGGLFLCRH